MILNVILEGLGLGILLILVCAVGYATEPSAWFIFTVKKCRTAVLMRE